MIRRRQERVWSGSTDSAAGGPPRREIELLLLCGRLGLEVAQSERLEQLYRTDLDWEYLLDRASRHGMLPLLHIHLAKIEAADGVGGCPPPLQGYFRQNTIRSLRLTAELLEVLRVFESAGIRAVPYKGPLLAARLYGNVCFRQAGDLDVLVSKKDVAAAIDLLLGRGYHFRYPTSPGTRAFRLANRYSEEMIGPDRVEIEVHWAFANRDVPFSLVMEDLEARLEAVEVFGTQVPTFCADDLLLILCVHGAKHRWDRLEWIVGISELIHRERGLDMDAILARADAARVRRTLLLGLQVAHDLLGTELPEPILSSIQRERWVTNLANDVRSRILEYEDYRGSASEILSRNLFQLPLQQTFGDQRRYLAYRLTTPNRPDNWRTVQVGERSLALHAFIWPFQLVRKLVTAPFRYGLPKR